jgi:NADH dehydrogenase [ubiquinone] 1 alpha subcomplex assembly factor 3
MTNIIILHSDFNLLTDSTAMNTHTKMSQNMLKSTRILAQVLGPVSHRPIAPTCTRAPTQQRPALAPTRCLHTTRPALMQSKPPKTRDRGPKSNEDTQTDFSALDVLRNTIAPATSIDACTSDGFALNNNVRLSGSGILLLGGEAFRWWPWARAGDVEGSGGMTGKLLNAKGQWEVQQESWGVLELVYPKPGKTADFRG